jgi:uncharacterized protein YqjF (DUF2071 family)
MSHKNIFLTAEWNNLLMLNYAVDASLLEPLVPAGTELDIFEGRAYLSLVGFEFNRSRIFGFAVPFHQRFEEVNLRFYVRRSSKRGVVFIRELVPKSAVAFVARFAFNENYSCVPMSHRIETRADGAVAKAEYAWRSGPDRCAIAIETEGASFLPPEGSASQFITEHYWGYAAQPGGGCLEYEVQHSQWCVWKARRAVFSGSAAGLYGAAIAQALAHTPDSAFLAKGSPVTVFKGKRIGRCEFHLRKGGCSTTAIARSASDSCSPPRRGGLDRY